MNQMHTFRNTIVIGLTALGMAASLGASAQSAAPEGRHGQAMSQEQRQARFAEHKAKAAERRAQRQAKLHEALKLNPAQEPAWASFTAAMQPAARPAHGERGAWQSLPAPQRMERALERAKQRQARMETRLAALKNLYAVLSPEQQKVLDQASARGHGRGHHGQRMHRS